MTATSAKPAAPPPEPSVTVTLTTEESRIVSLTATPCRFAPASAEIVLSVDGTSVILRPSDASALRRALLLTARYATIDRAGGR